MVRRGVRRVFAIPVRGVKHVDVIEAYGSERYRAGKADAVRDSLFLLLEARSIALDTGVRQRIAACCDVVTLQRWLTRAATASTTHEIFADEHDAR